MWEKKHANSMATPAWRQKTFACHGQTPSQRLRSSTGWSWSSHNMQEQRMRILNVLPFSPLENAAKSLKTSMLSHFVAFKMTTRRRGKTKVKAGWLPHQCSRVMKPFPLGNNRCIHVSLRINILVISSIGSFCCIALAALHGSQSRESKAVAERLRLHADVGTACTTGSLAYCEGRSEERYGNAGKWSG